MYYQSVGRNCNLWIGEVITPEGLVPEHDLRVLEEFEKEIKRRFGTSLARTEGTGDEIRLDLPRTEKISHIVIREAIESGERIREYEVEGMVNGQWRSLCKGQSVGHKRIEQIKEVNCTALRLKIRKSTAARTIREFSVFGPEGA